MTGSLELRLISVILGHVDTRICAAIARRAVIELAYNDGTMRVVEPHQHGTGPDGEEILFAYQLSGDSSSGRPAGWKVFHVDRVTQVRDTRTRFLAPRPDYRPTDRWIVAEHCAL